MCVCEEGGGGGGGWGGLGRERGVTADGVCYWYFDNTVLSTLVVVLLYW